MTRMKAQDANGQASAGVAGPVLVAVIGPPAAGKSTLVAALTRHARVPVFRLREAIRACPNLLAGLAPSPDPLGWVGSEAVRRVLEAEFVQGRLSFGSEAVLLDNFPGTAGQLELLADTARLIGARVAVLELRAHTRTVVARVAERRVCRSCGPDSHAPAAATDHDPERCRTCGSTLARRDTDVPGLHGLRLARYAANLSAITEAAAERDIPHVIVPADDDLPEVYRLARRAVHRWTTNPP